MPELEFDPVDDIATGAVGVPGQRAFYIQATKDGQTVAVLVEKEQVAILSARIDTLLDEVATQFPAAEKEAQASDVVGDPVPLFRALAIGIGFDPIRQMVLLELHERPLAEDDEDDEDDEEGPPLLPPEDVPGEEGEGWLARLYLSAGQARAMARHGSATVLAGRPRARCAATPWTRTATSAPS